MTNFSIYTNVKQTKSDETITIAAIADRIREPSTVVDRVRKLTREYVVNKDKGLKSIIGTLKASLHYFTPAGVFSTRTNAGLIEYSGIVQLDIDIKHPDGFALVPAIKQVVMSLPYVSLAFVSPSGCGVKALAHTTNTNPDHHQDVVYQLCAIVGDALSDITAQVADKVKGDIVDTCAKALSQPCYLSYDPDVYYNPNHTQWEYVYVEPEQKVQVAKAKRTVVARTVVVPERSDKHQERLLANYVRRKRIYNEQTKMEEPLQQKTNHSKVLIGYANSIGIDEAVLRHYMRTNAWDEDDIDRVGYMYEKYADHYGVYAGEKIVEAPVPVVMEVMNQDTSRKTITLAKGQYLSDVIDGRALTKNTNIIAPTGSGKTHLVFDGPQVWVFPTTALCYQFWVNHQTARTVWGDAPNIDGDANMIITTYDSCAKALHDIDITKYTLVFDEFHNYTVSSAPGYKLKALRSTLPFVLIAKKVITLTATPFYHEISEFQGFDTIEVKNAESFVRNVQILRSEESRRNDVIKQITESGRFSLVFLQTTDRNVLRTWEQGFNANGKEVVFINSTTKGDTDFNDIITNSTVRKDCVYISTSVIAEGVSILTELDTVDVYIMGSHHPYLIEQVSRRFRNIKTLNVYLLTNIESSTSDVKSLVHVDIISESHREELKSAAILMCESYEGSGIKLADFNIIGMPICEDKSGEWVVDELLIEYLTYQKVCSIYAGSVELTVSALVDLYGYKFGGEVISNEQAVFTPPHKTGEIDITSARALAIGFIFGDGVDVGEDPEFKESFSKALKTIKRLCNEIPGLKRLGRDSLVKLMDVYNAWGDKASARFIRYAKMLNSGIDEREAYRSGVIDLCLSTPRTSDELIRMGGLVFDTDYASASDRQKMEMVMSVMMGFDVERTTRDNEKVYVVTPNSEKQEVQKALAKLDTFGY